MSFIPLHFKLGKNNMRVFFFIISLLTVFSVFSSSTDNLQLSGYYYGKNLIVINPMIGDKYVVESVKVNGLPTNDEISSSVFEVDFQSMDIAFGSQVEIIISYIVSQQKPIVFNPEVLEPESNFSFKDCNIDKKEMCVSWTIAGSPGEEAFEIEQYRWEKWVRIGMVKPSDSVSYNHYKAKVDAHSGKNLFRIKVIDSKGMINYSPSLKYLSRSEAVVISNKSYDEEIIFSASTMYQLYDEKGILVASGIADRIDVRAFAEGKYWLNFGVETQSLKIK